MIQWPQGGSKTPESVALILRNGGSQSPDRWLRRGRNNHLLVRNIRITVEDIGAAFSILCFLDIPRILEFRAVVGKYDREIPAEQAKPKREGQGINSVNDLSLGTAFEKDHDHEGTAPKEEC